MPSKVLSPIDAMACAGSDAMADDQEGRPVPTGLLRGPPLSMATSSTSVSSLCDRLLESLDAHVGRPRVFLGTVNPCGDRR